MCWLFLYKNKYNTTLFNLRIGFFTNKIQKIRCFLIDIIEILRLKTAKREWNNQMEFWTSLQNFCNFNENMENFRC